MTLFEAFGEKKSLREWTADSRCKVSVGNIKNRMANGETFQEAMSRPVRKSQASKKILAFGEKKSIKEWAADSRCVVPPGTLLNRLKNKVPPELAISQPQYKCKLYTAFGESKPLKDWLNDPRCIVSYTTLMNRIKSGIPIEAAIANSKRADQKARTAGKRYSAFGEEKTLLEWSKDPRCVVSLETIHGRLARNRDLEDALTMPMFGRQLFHAFGEDKLLKEWAIDPRCVVSFPTLKSRLDRHEPFQSALTRRK
jgi:Leu/Phe-tRNA-protein transferase